MGAGGHVFVGRFRVVETKDAIDNRLDLIRRNRGVHRFESLHRADGNALYIGALGKNQSRMELTGATAQSADDADLAADPYGVKRERKGVGAADFEHMIDAATAVKRDRRLVPFRSGLVVDAEGRPERFGALELLVACRGDDGADAHRAGKLQREY